ncbi:DNA-binding protein [Brevibacillus brevis]|nr:DNA-binding protein [Brevibacillus brevis]
MKVSPPSLRRLSNVLGVSVAFLGCFEKLPESTFSALIGISERTLYEWEHDRKIPPPTPLNDLSKYLAVLMKE